MQKQLQTEEPTAPFIAPSVTETAPAQNDELTETQQKQTVRSRFAEIRHKTNRRKRRYWTLFWLFEAIAVLPGLLMRLLPVSNHNPLHFVPVWVSLAAVICLVIFLIATLTRKPKWNADTLAQEGGINAVPALLEMLFAPGTPQHRQPIYAALLPLLPLLRPENASLLNHIHRRMLNRMLRLGTAYVVDNNMGNSMRFAILKALAQVGDATSLATVERLANATARTPERETLKQAAIECLPMLKANLSTVQSTQTLLRASNAPAATPDTLLRPTEHVPDTAPQTLLRASTSDQTLPTP